MASLLRTVRLLAAAVGLVAWLLAVPAASAQELVVAQIHEIQGAAHLSPFNGQDVAGVEGIVTVERSSSFWMQDPTPDTDEATSDGILVFGSGVGALVNVGDHVRVSGRVVEFRPGGETTDNLTTTEITTPGLSVAVLSSGNPLPAPTVVGAGGRVPPSTVIEDDATGSVETSGIFDPATDGIDFYESLEGMRVQVNQALAVGPRNGFGEIPVVGDRSALAGVDSVRGGILVRPNDFNPERIILDDTLRRDPGGQRQGQLHHPGGGGHGLQLRQLQAQHHRPAGPGRRRPAARDHPRSPGPGTGGGDLQRREPGPR